MATNTTNLGLIKPAVNSATDEDLWGGQINSNLDSLDSEAVLKTVDLDFADNTLSKPVLKDYAEELETDTSTSNVWTIDFEDGNHHEIVLGENITTITISNAPSTGNVGLLVLYIKQDGTGGRTVSFPSSIKWAGGASPTVTSTASRTDIITLITRDGGTTFAGSVMGQDYTGI